MYYATELKFLIGILKKMHLQVLVMDSDVQSLQVNNLGVSKFLERSREYERRFMEYHKWAQENTIYKLTDEFACRYFFLLLPGTLDPVPVLIGPYMTFELSHEQLLEGAERFGIPAWRISELESYFADVPVIADETALFSIINTFGEVLWGGNNAFKIIDINRELTEAHSPIAPAGEVESQGNTMIRMEQMERRYAYENELMENVAHGHSQRAEIMLSNFTKMAFEQRMTDPIRNMKNYIIICNTLMRKAAEKGGVHPIYLDKVSSGFAYRIEGLSGIEAGQALMVEMAHDYCRLVRKHATQKYSPPVQKAVACIDSDLSGDLSLSTLAASQNINASYLSALFRKETGKTLTEYVNDKRMQAAARLLQSTHLQIQTVAQHCGMSDVNYFSKIFKKHYEMTPKQYREQTRPYLPQ